MSFNPFGCLFATPVLPFDDEGGIDEAAYRAFLRRFLESRYVDAGLALVANPEAGEVFCLGREERRRTIRIVLDEADRRVPVIAGVIDVTTTGYIRAAEDAAELGVDGLFMFPPIGAGDITLGWDADRYPEIFVDVLRAVADRVDLPMVVHPVGPLTPQWGAGLPAGLTRRVLEEVPNVVGWKMTYGYDGYRSITRTIRAVDRPVAILGANAKFFHENLADGAFDGAVSGGLNYALEPMIEHILAWNRGDLDRAREIWHGGLAQLHEYVFAEATRLHVRYKTAAWLRGCIPNPFMRAPMPRPDIREIDEIRARLQAAGLDVIDGAAIERSTSLLPRALAQTA
jgi:4-hydroxy-tetrahydrodipicolinate synthase